MSKKAISQNQLALQRFGKLFNDLTPREQEEILADMELETLAGRRETVFTDRSRLFYMHPRARAGREEYAEGKSGSLRDRGATRRRAVPHDHDEKGRHIPLEGGERKG